MDGQYWCYLVFLAGLLSCYVIASDWPEGSYGLPMAKSGCPAGATFRWETGWVYQDTENDNPQSSKSVSFHIEGQVKLSAVNRSFCIKEDTSGDYQRLDWPSGTYCIYQKAGYCPAGFRQGSVKWDDEDDNNENYHQGTVPRMTYGWPTTTRIFFCCRNDRMKAVPTDLPVASPFYLLAHSSEKCQQVGWAVATSEWIYYDTEDDRGKSFNTVTDPAPYITKRKGDGLKVYYCYYTSCKYSLNTSTGSIESPHFPANYPNGQQCSWKISVEASHSIFVRFLNFSLDDIDDSLKFYDGANEAASPLATLDGGSTPSDIARVFIQSSASNLFVVFHSNELGTSSGFKAIYSTTAFSTSAPTTTKETTVDTVRTTKTHQTTTEAQVVTEKTNPSETAPSSNLPSKSSTEPISPPKGNSSKNYDAFKKTCVQQSQSTLIAVAIVIPLICLIAVIAMAVYLFFRLRNLREKPSDVSVRYITTTTTTAAASATPESLNNPAYLSSDAVIEARGPSSDSVYEDNKGDIYHEIEPSRQATDNPLYQSTDEDKHVYASFA